MTSTKKKITRGMTFADVLSISPRAGEIMFQYGLHCIGCHLSPYETVEEGSKTHGLSDKQIDEMIEKINKVGK